MLTKTYTFLNLGDSYTIGENVAIHDSFPYQTIQLLRKAGHNFNAPEILAKTGWTTEDLKKGIRSTILQTSYNFVSLLIGVNDQYQGKDVMEYEARFEQLLLQAVSLTANKPEHVFVLSIPDWSLTPYTGSRNKDEISKEIENFNSINKKLSAAHNIEYIAIARSTGAGMPDETFLATDKLHPSAKEYAKWASQLFDAVQKQLI